MRQNRHAGHPRHSDAVKLKFGRDRHRGDVKFLTLTFFRQDIVVGLIKRAKIIRLFAVFDALEAAGPPAARRCENRRVAGRAPPVARRVCCAAGGARAVVRGTKVATSRLSPAFAFLEESALNFN